jgi:hypothetical protein
MEEDNHSVKRKPACSLVVVGRSVRRKTAVHHPGDVPIDAGGSTWQQKVVSESVLQQKTLVDLKEMLQLRSTA